jgi:acyl-CoA synthetase (AMP-forming)/AMP-acid ligase II
MQGARQFEQSMDADPPSIALPAPEAGAPAAIFFTSGSTGPAKGVTHSFESLGWMFASVAKGYALTPDDVMLPASSCSHIGGFSFAMASLSVGARVAIARAFDHAELGPLVRAARPTVISTLPATLLRLIREPDTTADDFSSLRMCRSGGDKVSAELEKEFHALTGHIVHEGYGMTETGIAANNPPHGLDKLGSVGLPNPGFVFSISYRGGKRDARRERGARLGPRAEPHVRLLERPCGDS